MYFFPSLWLTFGVSGWVHAQATSSEGTVLSVLSGSSVLKNVRVSRYENPFISFLEAIKIAGLAHKKKQKKKTSKNEKKNKTKKKTKKKKKKKKKKTVGRISGNAGRPFFRSTNQFRTTLLICPCFESLAMKQIHGFQVRCQPRQL